MYATRDVTVLIYLLSRSSVTSYEAPLLCC